MGKREGCQGDWVKSEDQEVAYSNSRRKGGRNFVGRAVKPPSDREVTRREMSGPRIKGSPELESCKRF